MKKLSAHLHSLKGLRIEAQMSRYRLPMSRTDHLEQFVDAHFSRALEEIQ